MHRTRWRTATAALVGVAAALLLSSTSHLPSASTAARDSSADTAPSVDTAPATSAAAAGSAATTGPLRTPRQADSELLTLGAGSSTYRDPCDVTAGTDLAAVSLSSLIDETGRVQRDVVLRADLCRPVDELVVRLDLLPRNDRIVGETTVPDYGESPPAAVILDVHGATATWRLRVGAVVTLIGSVSVGRTPDGAVTNVTASVPGCQILEVVGSGCDEDGRPVDLPSPELPPLGLRACTADLDCGPSYRTVSGRTEPDATPIAPGVDYVPEPSHYPVTYPSVCQQGTAANPQGALLRLAAVPSDPAYAPSELSTGQWALRRVGLEQAWDVTRGAGSTVAIIDSGVDPTHPDLAGNVAVIRDFVPSRSSSVSRSLPIVRDADPYGHGTFVTSVIAAKADGAGMVGLAPETRILVARVVDAEGCASDPAVAAAMRWAAAEGADVVNISLGGSAPAPLLADAAADLAAAGVVVVAASGNSGGEHLEYPAAYPDVVSVAATAFSAPTDPDVPAAYASWNDEVDLAAPGGDGAGAGIRNVLGACRNADHAHSLCRAAGSSFAAPQVTAAIALLRSLDPARTVPAIRDLLADTAADVVTGVGAAPGWDARTGAGRLAAGVATSLLAGRGDPLVRIPTEDPVSSSVAVSQLVFDPGGARHAVLARGDEYADALAGISLVGDDTPLLLTPRDRVPERVASELVRILPAGSSVYLMGGEQALGPEVEAAVRALGFEPLRIAGSNRVHTALVASSLTTAADEVVITSARSWPDAAAAGLYASGRDVPVLLTEPDVLDPDVVARIDRLQPELVTVVGGTGAVAPSVEATLAETFDGPIRRIAGPTRMATATAVATDAWERQQGGRGDVFVVVNAWHPTAWAYALVAAPLAARQQAPLLLVDDGVTSPTVTTLLRDRLGYRLGAPATGILVGPAASDPGRAAATAQRLRELLGG